MPGVAWPCRNSWSPEPSVSLPLKKWLNPISYSQAAEAYVEMWPPSPRREPRETIAAAFHRFRAVIRDSIARSPGKSGCAATGMVLM